MATGVHADAGTPATLRAVIFPRISGEAESRLQAMPAAAALRELLPQAQVLSDLHTPNFM